MAWHSEGIKMTVGSEKPHLFTENDAGKVVMYHLKVNTEGHRCMCVCVCVCTQECVFVCVEAFTYVM